MCSCSREKSQIVALSTFDQREFREEQNILMNKCTVCPFMHTVNLFIKIYFFIHVDPKYSMKQFEIFP